MATKQPVHINLATLAIGQHVLDLELDNLFFESLPQDDILGGKCLAKVTIGARESSFTLHLEVKGTVQVTCDRCLDPMDVTVEPFEEDFLLRLADEDGEDDNAIYVDRNHTEFDLGWLLYEVIDVRLPIVHAHEPGECNPEMERILQEHLAEDGE